MTAELKDFNIVSCYNKREGIDHYVGYAVEIPMSVAKVDGIYFDYEKGIVPTVCVEKLRSDKLLPVSIMHGQIKYAEPVPRYLCEKTPGKFEVITDKIVCDYALKAMEKYEAEFGEYHEDKEPQELNLMVDFPSFGKQVESLEEDLETEYDLEELE